MDKLTSDNDYQLLFKIKFKESENTWDLPLWFVDGRVSQFCPLYWRIFFNNLIKYCNIQDLHFVYHEKTKELSAYAKKMIAVNETLVEKCIEFNSYNGSDNIFTSDYPSIPYSSPKNMAEKSRLTYFDFSLFKRYFKNSNDPFLEDLKRNKYSKNSEHLFGAYILLEPTTYCIGTRLTAKGQMSVRDVFLKTETMPYGEINDIGELITEIEEKNDEVTIVTKIDLTRALEINPQDLVSMATSFYELLTKEGDYLTCTDHFVVIASGTRLLHYCDEYHCFEVFYLPDDWNFQMGITEEMYASRKIFTDNIFDEQDPDIKEIYEVLDNRKLKKHYSS